MAWQNGLASLTQVFDLRSLQIAFRLATHLRWLATTLLELNFGRKSTQVSTVWPPNTSRHKLIASELYMRGNLQLFCNLRELASRLRGERIRLATHRKFWFCKLVSTCESVWPGFLGPAWRRVFHAHYSINELLLYEKYAVWTIKFAWIRCIIQLWYRRRFKRRISHAPCIMHDF